MQINTNKTKHMVINDQNNQVSIQPTLNNQTLEKVSNYKYLGASIKKSSTATNNGMQYQKKTISAYTPTNTEIATCKQLYE